MIADRSRVATSGFLPEAQGRLADGMPVAVIDIGSNSIRLVVYEKGGRSPAPLFNEKVLAGLGRVVAETGRIEGESLERTYAALARFRAIQLQLGASKPWVVATAAVREARNSNEFVREVERICGATVMLLSGPREASLAAAGVISGFYRPDGIAADMGGGSLELVDVAATGAIGEGATLQLGGLRLSRRAAGNLAKAAKIAVADLDTIDWLKLGRKRPLYAVGGTWRNIAKLHMVAADYPLRVTHGYGIEPDAMVEFCGRLARGKLLASLSARASVSDARLEVIPYGAVVLKALIKRLQPKSVVFSIFGIREGLLHTLLPREERERDPLITFCQDYARLRARSPQHAQELCAWTDRLFVHAGSEETDDERRLRHAACLISDISWRAHPDYRGEQSLNVIAHAALAGIDHPGRVFLALAVYIRHTGGELNDFSERLMKLLSRREQQRARVVGLAIRAAHMLSVGAAGVIDRTRLGLEGRSLVLSIPRAIAALDGERFRKRYGAMCGALGFDAVVRIGRV